MRLWRWIGAAGALGLGFVCSVLGASCEEVGERDADTTAGGGGEGTDPTAGGAAGVAAADPFALCAVPTHPCGSATNDCGCTPELLCDHNSPAVRCGLPGSFLDAAGCLRQICASDDECATGFRCVPSALVSDLCLPSELEGCDDCFCITVTDCGGTVTCIEEELVPPELDCDLSGAECPTIDREDGLTGVLQRRDLSDALRAKVEECLARVRAARAACGLEP